MGNKDRAKAKMLNMFKRVTSTRSLMDSTRDARKEEDQEELDPEESRRQTQYRLESNVRLVPIVCVLSTRLVSHSIPLYYLSLFLSLSLSLAICHWLNLSLFVLCTTHTAQRESFLVVALFLWLAGHGWQSGQHGFVPQPEFGHVVALDVSGEFFLSLCHELHCLFCLDHFLCRIHHCGRTPRPRMRPHRWR